MFTTVNTEHEISFLLL